MDSWAALDHTPTQHAWALGILSTSPQTPQKTTPIPKYGTHTAQRTDFAGTAHQQPSMAWMHSATPAPRSIAACSAAYSAACLRRSEAAW